eukprot:CAMPEP_0116012938 /NCGR_PEP_ID=MMETSP0321-20121206/5424_1 /TAXON_ID=163516 /ORGANISM="Leptocylindrus danicus var. danicus, Strain B650" /LENGTH=291 /DNA_ID=CAMNT_0003482383 /DNA_START=85 /DNA_END=960 /DNA_ORIENTATION=+
MTDVLTGTLANSAILAALHQRNATGKGQRVDASLMESQLAGLVNIAGSSLNTTKFKTKRWGTAHASIVPYQAFVCSCGEALVIGAGNDVQYQHLCKVLLLGTANNDDSVDESRLLLQEDQFATNSKRVQHRHVLIPLLERLFRQRTRDEWLQITEEYSASNNGGAETALFPHGPIRSVPEAFACEQALHRDMVMEVEHPELVEPIRLPGVPVKYNSNIQASSLFDHEDISIPAGNKSDLLRMIPPPMLGEHTQEILHDVLDIDEIRELEIEGAISCWKRATEKEFDENMQR